MDITPQQSTQQPISDDQELAKALAGVMPGVEPVIDAPADDVTTAHSAPDLQFEETPPSGVTTDAESHDANQTPSDPIETPSLPPLESSDSGDLASIKKDALLELRPLMDKVDLPAEEKFDTYLMLIRSTDDATLIAPAHAAAAGISDEKRRAEALLDIIKEIDYLSRDKQAPAQ